MGGIPHPVEVEITLCKKHIKKVLFESDCELKVQEHRINKDMEESIRNNSLMAKEKKGQDRIFKQNKQKDVLL